VKIFFIFFLSLSRGCPCVHNFVLSRFVVDVWLVKNEDLTRNLLLEKSQVGQYSRCTSSYLIPFLSFFKGESPHEMGKVHGSLARAGKVKNQTPKVAKKEKAKVPRGRALKRLKYNKRFLSQKVEPGMKVKMNPQALRQ
jgi:small subunit ribosomal protein S30e